ncbi:hypothetical protein TBR22_A02120 [Luteitalea sp. TBR-22]|uniref:QcrA and Rieske domain-containing protein n=1 Tax=Luteitalea sp. TBR-22 TaxID=2802971 RepID=UPI001AF05CD4|nr:Rieske (2Fe-2S) protein [Luteitalea sp. TBR-22]BCS31013.1 hypothetical protein TBR22_A02120 [Luteitalea sp. TBR-22]
MKEQATPPLDQTRRTFCAHTCLSAAAVALGALSSACGGSGSSSTSPGGSGSTGTGLGTANATVSGRTVTVALDGSPLTGPGTAALVRTGVGSYLVARTGADTFTALTATCTHESQTVNNWTGSQYVCTAHGAMFNTSGTVARGPANRALTAYPTTFANNTVTFTV